MLKIRNAVMNELKKNGYNVETYDGIKNGVACHGIVNITEETKKRFVPVVWIERLVEDYGYNVKRIVDVIISIFNDEPIAFDEKKYFNPSYILKNVTVRVRKKIDSDILKRDSEFEGLETCLCVKCDDIEASYMLRERMVKELELNEEVLWANAWKDVRENIVVEKLTKFVYETTGTILPDLGTYIVSNKNFVNGAIGGLDEEFIKEFFKKKGFDGVVVLPSSIHEMLLIPFNEDDYLDMNYFSQMVREVNCQEVSLTERLTDKAYTYKF